MKNIPVFTSPGGVASLVLEEIPYKKEAYISIHEASDFEVLVADCISFCKAIGAERIYASGDMPQNRYPIHTEVWMLSANCHKLPMTNASLVPVTENTLADWIEIYNAKMANVHNAATMNKEKIKKLLESKDAYFVYNDGLLIGICKGKNDKIEVIASAIKGGGMDVVLAMCNTLSVPMVYIDVASSNKKALDLYNKLGFLKQECISVWYKVL